MTDLYPYQLVGAQFLAMKGRALLADECGLGKSAQAIAACDALGVEAVFVVCPASVVENWRREFAKFSKVKRLINVVSYEKATKIAQECLVKGIHPVWDAMILDEAHYLKSATAKRTKAIFGPKCDGVGGLVERAKHVFLLTGTPMPNNPGELWTALRALAPESITSPKTGKVYSYWQFVQKYCVTRDNGFGIQITGGRNHEELRQKIAPFMLRRLKAEVLPELPSITFDNLYLEGSLKLDDVAGEEAKKAAKALEAKGIEGLREIAPHVATLRRLTGMAKVTPVVEWVKDWLANGGEKIVLFAHHREVIIQIGLALTREWAKAGEAYYHRVTVTGDTETGKRQTYIDMFQNDPDCRVFIGQIQAAGTGITLTAASDVLFVESSWTPSENSQAAMRTHRIGQKNAVLVRFATLAGSIDEQIQKAVARKTADITKIVG